MQPVSTRLFDRVVPPTSLGHQINNDISLWVVNCADDMLRVDNLNLSVSCNIPSGYCTSTLLLKAQLDWVIAVNNQVNTLEVEHDVGDIFLDARHRSELVRCTLHSESRKGSAANTAQ